MSAASTADVIDFLTAIGTLGAAAFAGWAAFSSRASARASVRLTEAEERRREQEAADEAKAVTSMMMTENLYDEAGVHVETDVFLSVSNDSGRPALRTRIRVTADEQVVWGPQLLGVLGPGQHVELRVRVDRAGDTRFGGQARFYDIHDRAWVAPVSGATVASSEGLDVWIPSAEEQREMQSRGPYYRGQTTGLTFPDFDDWRAEMDTLSGS